MYLVFDTETTGLPRDWKAPITDTDNWPRCVQIAWQIHNEFGELIEVNDFLIRPNGFNIPYEAEKIHGISTELANQKGEDLNFVLEKFNQAIEKTDFIVGHNVGFDINIMLCEFYRLSINTKLKSLRVLDTCSEKTANMCQLKGGRGGKFKLPNLTELHTFLFGSDFDEAHNATADVVATTRCFLELIRKGLFSYQELGKDSDYILKYQELNNSLTEPISIVHVNLKSESEILKIKNKDQQQSEDFSNDVDLSNYSFSHLHNRSQFSVLQSTTEIKKLINKAYEFQMPAVGLTDDSNFYGAFHFLKNIYDHPANKEIIEHNKKVQKGELNAEIKEFEIKGVLGCELSICRDHLDKSKQDNGHKMVFLCKNKNGYHNLSKMSSIAFVDGFYYVPRIDKKIVEKYKDDLIVLSGGPRGEIANLILNVGETQAEESFVWWKNTFKEDFYVELVRHGLEHEDKVNEVMLSFAKKHQVKVVASNETYYLEKDDSNAHDILLCVKDGELQSTPKGKGRGFRYGLSNDEYYFKSQEEMKKLFKDIPDAIINVEEVLEKIENFELKRDVLLPKFEIPKEFIVDQDEVDGGKRGENAYLKHITFEGAKKRYKTITPEIEDRLNFELKTIENSGYPGYFLIVQDFTSKAREMAVSVGPGRGSAAGSAVAYCIEITNVDPIKYDLLFERFLNPDRVSLPDIDIDFDDEGRNKIIEWVVNKYGKNQVAQIITYGTMAAKSAIRDTARVLDLPLSEADQLAKKIPDIKLNKLFNFDDKELKEKLSGEQYQQAQDLLELSKSESLKSQTLNQATILEGSVRNIGIHACGVIITPDDISKFVPVTTAKDADLLVTQFDNSVVEDAGMLKMDFLGLKNLTIIKDCCKIVKHIHNIEIDVDSIPLDDEKTYELFQKGETNGVFQFESVGMQKNLKLLKPDKFDDLIAMNALYRPGPMEYIPDFIARKHGKEEIIYDLPEMAEYLADTYGITVYQEQVMLLSQSLAGFSKGDADVLRKAMGKKIFALLEKLKPKFLSGCEQNGHDVEIASKIWKDWEAFAAYAFNKSHSTCYALIAFQTAYLKAHYPAEYMAAYLTHNMNDIKKVTFYMEECKRMGLKVLGPDINESFYKFAVNKNGEIRFGLGAIKGVGEGAVEAIVKERKENGNYPSIFELTKRIDLKSVNKRAFESLAYAGAFDSFGHERSSYFYKENDITFLEKGVKYGQKHQQNSNSSQVSLFGGESADLILLEPQVPNCDPWPTLTQLNNEKEVVGFYISGHPLDDYKLEMKSFCNFNISEIKGFDLMKGKDIRIAGMVSEVEHRFTKKGKPFGTISIEDYHDNITFFLFGEEYPKYKPYMTKGWFLYAQCRVQERKWQEGQLEIKIVSLELLSEIKEKTKRSVVLKMELDHLKNDHFENISNLCEQNKGKHNLKFMINDLSEGYQVSLKSKKYKVNLDDNFLNSLKQIPNIELEIN